MVTNNSDVTIDEASNTSVLKEITVSAYSLLRAKELQIKCGEMLMGWLLLTIHKMVDGDSAISNCVHEHKIFLMFVRMTILL